MVVQRVLLTGATGLVGRAVVARLRAEGWAVVAWVRSLERAGMVLGGGCELVAAADGDGALQDVVGRCEAVVNLAGEPVVASIWGPRWTPGRREVLRASRIGVTQRIVAAMHAVASSERPTGRGSGARCLISASGIGYYGDTGAREVDENSAPGSDFLAQLCVEWEAAARRAEGFGTRVVLLRTSAVLTRRGGALGKMLPVFRLGLGGPVAGGRQYLPWIHIEDVVGAMVATLKDERHRGPINLVAPEAVTNREFSHALGRALHRPAVLPMPAGALRLMLGEAAEVLIAGQRAVPRALRELGYEFRHPRLAAALGELLAGGGG